MSRRLKWSLCGGLIGLGYGFTTIPEGSIFYNGGFLIGTFIGMSVMGLIAEFLYDFFTKK
jgi:hypothetical protein